MFANIEALENFIAQWEAGVLPKAQWTHAAHVAVGTYGCTSDTTASTS